MTSTLPPLAQAFAGGIGSVAANTGSYPLDVIITRLQTKRASSDIKPHTSLHEAWNVFKGIVEEDGWLGLYSGLESDSAATLISNFVYYYAYSYLRTYFVKRKVLKTVDTATKTSLLQAGSTMLSVPEELGLGFIAGVISRTISTPFSVLTVRKQLKKETRGLREVHASNDNSDSEDEGDGSSTSVKDVALEIYRTEGLSGFWKGFQSTILLCSNPAITLCLFQLYRRVFLRGKDRNTPSPAQGFIGGAVSNAIATALLYPLILIKTRQQSSRSSRAGKKSLLAIANSTIKRHGVKGLYQGLEAQIAKGFFNQGVTMMTKQRIEELLVMLYLMSVTRPPMALE